MKPPGIEPILDRSSGAAEEDLRALSALFSAYCDAVYNHCFRRTASWDDAQELTAMVFLEAWRRRRAIPGEPAGALPWLLAVANNVLRNQRRSRRRYQRVLHHVVPQAPQPDPADRIADRVDAERSMRALLPALSALPRREREVIELCAGAGLTHEEASHALSIPVGTVKSRLSRGLARLRRHEAAAHVLVNRDITEGGPS